MHLLLLRILLAFVMMSTVARALQDKRCGCSQCNHIAESLKRCECCVYLLHGKRSLTKRVIHALSSTETETEGDVDFYDIDKRIPPEFRPIGEFGRSLTDTAKIISTEYLDDRASAYVRDEPFQGTSREISSDSDDSFDTLWRRILRYVNGHGQSEDTYVLLV